MADSRGGSEGGGRRGSSSRGQGNAGGRGRDSGGTRGAGGRNSGSGSRSGAGGRTGGPGGRGGSGGRKSGPGGRGGSARSGGFGGGSREGGGGGQRAPREPRVVPDSAIVDRPGRDEWRDDGRVDGGGTARAERPKRSSRGEAARAARLSVSPEAFGQAVSPRRADRLARRVGDAAVSFEADRFDEARSILGPIAKETPDVAEVRELLGLTYYRLGRWRDAVRELEAFFALTSSTEQHPVLADSYRALGRHARVEELWSELREDSPSAELVHEGRIVSAGSLADQDRLADAIRLLEKGWKTPRQPKDHHLRRGYALADLYERAGSVPRARQLFVWLNQVAPDFADVVVRLDSLE